MLRSKHTLRQEDVQLSAQCPIRVQRVELDVEQAPHSHEFYELVYIRSGHATHITADFRRTIQAGSFLLMPPGSVHAFEDVDALTLYNIYYLAEWLLSDLQLLEESPQLCMRFLGRSLFPNRNNGQATQITLPDLLAASTEHELEQFNAVDTLGDQAPIFQRATLIKCLALWHAAIEAHTPSRIDFLENPQIRRVIQLIEHNIRNGEPGQLKQWAQSMHYSPDHLSRLFKSKTGENPSHYYQRRRLQQATVAIVKSPKSFSEIAHQYGFSDSAHLSREFQKHYQCSPKVYRARFQKRLRKKMIL